MTPRFASSPPPSTTPTVNAIPDLRERRRQREVALAFTRLPPEALRANTFSDDIREIYEDTFVTLIRDTQLLPGIGAADEMLAERQAFFFAMLKERDMRGNRSRWDPDQYVRLNELMLKSIDLRTKTLKAVPIDEVLQRHMARTVADTLLQLIETVAQSPEQEAAMKALMPRVMAANL